jgi:hypothetical protein
VNKLKMGGACTKSEEDTGPQRISKRNTKSKILGKGKLVKFVPFDDGDKKPVSFEDDALPLLKCNEVFRFVCGITI